MKKFLFSLMIVISALCSACSNGDSMAVEDPLTIPFYGKIVVDGNGSDWNETGLYIPLISNLYGELNPLDFTADLKMSWDMDQLYFIVSVKDDALFEHESPLRGDGLEIFISQEKGTNKMIQYIIAPGVTEAFDDPRIDKYDYVERGPEGDVDDLNIVSVTVEGGYIMEGSIPWEELGIVPASGGEWALNMYVSDVDPGERKTRYALYFNQDTWSNHFALQMMQFDSLSEKRSIPLIIKAYIEDRSTLRSGCLLTWKPKARRFTFKMGRDLKER